MRMHKLGRAGNTVGRSVELVLVGLVASGLAGLACAALGIFKAPQVLTFGLLASAVYGYIGRGPEVTQADRPDLPLLPLLSLLLVALLFRVPAIDYASGGQDQGVYVNMAAHIVRTGGFAIDDPVSKRLQGSDAEQRYQAENAPLNGDFLLGIFERDTASGPHFEFQFYHLFSVYMALAAGIFGLASGVSALTLLSLLSVLLFFALAMELTGRVRVAMAAGLLLAVNPLHAFFSRFPVTEVPTLCFALGSAWLLVRVWKDRESGENANARRWLRLLLSIGSLTCAFLIRMTGFMYLPVILLIGLSACLFERDAQVRKLVFAWTMLANAAYLATLLYGRIYSPIYTGVHLQFAFGGLGPHWSTWMFAAWAAALGALLVAFRLPPDAALTQHLRNGVGRVRGWLGVLALLSLPIWLYKLYLLGWTNRYAADPWLADRWSIAATKFGVFRYSSLVVAAENLGPLICLLFFGFAWSRRLPGVIGILGAMVLMFLFYIVGPQYVLAYQPYYSRYLASEFVPYVILLVVAACSFVEGRWLKRVSTVVLVASALYGTVLSIGQLRANEQSGMAQAYERVATHVGQDDVLLLDVSSLTLPYQLIEMPFLARHGLHVARASQSSLSDAHYLNALQSRFDRIFLLSGRPGQPPGFRPVDSVRFHEWVAEQGTHPPIRSTERFHGRTYLSVRSDAVIEAGQWMEISALADAAGGSEWSVVFARGWSVPEPWGMWSDGDQAVADVPAALADGSPTRLLTVKVKPFATPGHPTQRVHLSVDGKAMPEVLLSAETTLAIPLEGTPSVSVHRVVFDLPDAITPAQAGAASSDPRKLGIGLLSARLDVAPLQ